jgi:hypothetical protein
LLNIALRHILHTTLMETNNKPMKKDVFSIFDAAVTIWLMTVGLESLDVLPLMTFMVIYLVLLTIALRPIFHMTLTDTKNQAMKKDAYYIFDAAVTIWLMTVGLGNLAVLPLRTFMIIYLVDVTFALRPIFHTTLMETKNQQ